MKSLHRITPFLWFNDTAEEAARFYVSLFPASRERNRTVYDESGAEVSGRPKGSTMTIPFELSGEKFVALNGGPVFQFTPAVSFFVGCYTEEEIDHLYMKLSDGGTVLMELAKYPFAEKYVWLNDKYGISWQLILATRSQKITPLLMFTGKMYGRAKEAMEFYTHMFKEKDKESQIKEVVYYDGAGKDPSDKVVHGVFSLAGEEFMAMDSGEPHQFTFTPAISFVIDCKNQEDIDYFWDKFAMSGKPGQCGWLEDKFGISWQIVPSVLPELLRDEDKIKSGRVMRVMLKMGKLDIETLKRAHAGPI